MVGRRAWAAVALVAGALAEEVALRVSVVDEARGASDGLVVGDSARLEVRCRLWGFPVKRPAWGPLRVVERSHHSARLGVRCRWLGR